MATLGSIDCRDSRAADHESLQHHRRHRMVRKRVSNYGLLSFPKEDVTKWHAQIPPHSVMLPIALGQVLHHFSDSHHLHGGYHRLRNRYTHLWRCAYVHCTDYRSSDCWLRRWRGVLGRLYHCGSQRAGVTKAIVRCTGQPHVRLWIRSRTVTRWCSDG